MTNLGSLGWSLRVGGRLHLQSKLSASWKFLERNQQPYTLTIISRLPYKMDGSLWTMSHMKFCHRDKRGNKHEQMILQEGSDKRHNAARSRPLEWVSRRDMEVLEFGKQCFEGMTFWSHSLCGMSPEQCEKNLIHWLIPSLWYYEDVRYFPTSRRQASILEFLQCHLHICLCKLT